MSLTKEISPVFVSIKREDPNYADVTEEKYRIGMDELQNNPLLSNSASKWFKTMSDTESLQMDRRHLHDRLKKYVGSLSMDRTYIEIYEDELEYILKLPECLKNHYAQIVEVGLNSDAKICKVSAVIKLPSNIKGRYLFICIGTADYGLKTCYVTPVYKRRIGYSGSVPSLTTAQYRKLMTQKYKQ